MFNKQNFIIKDFCAKNSVRPELNGIFVEPNRTTATDSVCLLSVSKPKASIADYPKVPDKPAPLENFKPFILPSQDAEIILKTLPKKASLPILEHAVIYKTTPETAEIGITDLQSNQTITPKVIQGEYPKFQDIMVERGGFTEILINPEFLQKIGKFFSQFTDGYKGITMKIPKEPDTPIRFYAKTEMQEATAILMPIKNSNAETEKYNN